MARTHEIKLTDDKQAYLYRSLEIPTTEGDEEGSHDPTSQYVKHTPSCTYVEHPFLLLTSSIPLPLLMPSILILFLEMTVAHL
ncbi:hypothetical protein E5676_scaffold522G001080 [Cucumis melo var. makuwa]|uniref:Uncharacterized protein n=1 Tax=Cucumis melo var. makuwa TaxID=1194695 RepID=A0A5D3D6J4_CUCMM|nr:hypothetical protein E6C27_scaffold190G001580 [Cucumis melo var. makuwa]TYK19177.1 hypothetical protein E5676_scaffold522G001080 [Cucumis melo var. makuwa]